ncbi:beta-galactosidase [Paenibacillus phyllosphaerae]|uniref:Beta-galactosidase n=1 Tax=Paenibacillus phyllosphaerae TaxID=274593 RepID=A0A7W5FQB2_9BACL|nr:glycoside hydrolase family 2 TIM barrel-domain containing protein [Paenibacillus phyllosphaerae]MBB3112844.1 beta-galactosidase [Paenibacillus phyllosphaerae]
MNSKTLFNDGWAFAKSGLAAQDPSGLQFAPVDLPHDWLIYDTLQLYEDSIGWYRKRFTCAKGDNRLLLAFDGVYMDSSVYVNDRLVGEWKYGYSAFEHDMTDALIDGENEIVVKVVHESPNSRWYSGAGIYRNVWLKTRSRDYIETDGVYISTEREDDGNWLIELDTALSLAGGATLSHSLVHQGQEIANVTGSFTATDGMIATNRLTLHVANPLLWSTEAPHLYQLVTELRSAGSPDEASGGELIETITQPVGFREFRLDPNEGFSLNGQRMKLNGVCEHHDLGALGAAFNKEAVRRRLLILKEMGANAIRTAHNMPAAELMDLADEMGLLIVSEAFDMWERSKTPYDYARFFPEWAARDVESWVRRDRNHPSLIMWSIGNEIYDTHADERGQEVTRMLMAEVLKHDPKGNAAITIGSNYMPWENAQKCADIVKVAGYNYAEKYYDAHHAAHPDWIIYGSETSSVVQSRGVYHFPLERSILTDDDEQCSSLGNSPTSWGAKSAEACILAERDRPYSLGQFLWTGFDYIGEPTPYHTKNSYFGQIDTATFPKDAYYVYQAAWTDYKAKPMIHLFPYWDFSPGQLIDVRVATNAPRVELRLNGVSQGVRDIDHQHGRELVPTWKLPYEAGELEAIAYDEAGQVIASEVKRSFDDASAISLEADKTTLVSNGTDVLYVAITMNDPAGNPVENANNRVRVDVTGAGRLLGLDNGDSTDYDPYKGTSRRLFSGKLMAIIGATTKPGEIRIEVSSKGMSAETIVVESTPYHGDLSGITATASNQAMPCVTGSEDEIPLRKIEIVSESGQLFTETAREMVVQAVLHPANTSYREVEWKVVNDAGIPSNLAVIEASGLEAIITALGDGDFRVRCMSKNGTDKTKLISQLEFRVEGLGTAYKDPYSFVSAGLYDFSKGEVGNGNERGVATSRDSETQVGFRDLDFGPLGSDRITMPIFALSSEPYELQIWEGMPGEAGSELIADVVYQKESRWNVYQEDTYRLSKRLRGITSICFVLQKKIHIKGFSFEPLNRAFVRNNAADCDRIYGDSFAVQAESVEGIGNNVSLEFGGLDFGEEGASRLVVYGRSPIDKNTIHVRLSGDGGESNQLIEFARTEGYEQREFELSPIKGRQHATFVFLPGSNFDFGWFQFKR